ncbi:thioredoxin family protein [Longirhabdus pacifica]|uniref:thioredoxin family protein n=1 Tax=Longirhabdus pacifica TaxID=2305227 RepID=UPI001008AE65|nr:thioredoxin family protein [Longirhabdus pacifica]
MQKLQSEQQYEQFISEDKLTMLVVKADWCPDCHFIDPFMPELMEKYSDFTFVEVDRDEFPDLCDRLHVMGIPSFIAFKQGKELVRYVNKLRKTKEEIERFFTQARAVAEEVSK